MAFTLHYVYLISHIVSVVMVIEAFVNESARVTGSSLQCNSVAKTNNIYSPCQNVSIDSLGSEYSYYEVHKIINDLFDLDRYNPMIRPVCNQSQALTVHLQLKVLDLVSIDDVKQRMVTGCYFVIWWIDELLKWKKDVDTLFLLPKLQDIWVPYLVSYNSLHRMNVIGETNKASPKLMKDGIVVWTFDGMLTTSCNLDMDKYPFDVQTCHIEIASPSYRREGLDFKLAENVDPIDTTLISDNYGWEILEKKAEIQYREYAPKILLPLAKFTLKMKRKPKFVIINDILPTVTVSFLNCFVFIVPADSGEKISFGISVLLALAVFVSNTGTRLPSATDGIPALTRYLGLLFENSIAAVFFTIFNVGLSHYVKEKRMSSMSSTSKERRIVSIGDDDQRHYNNNAESDEKESDTKDNPGRLKLSKTVIVLEKVLKYIEIIGFIVVMGNWCAVTVWYVTYLES